MNEITKNDTDQTLTIPGEWVHCLEARHAQSVVSADALNMEPVLLIKNAITRHILAEISKLVGETLEITDDGEGTLTGRFQLMVVLPTQLPVEPT